MLTLDKILPCKATLVIEDSRYQRKISLKEKVYTIGRHSSNSIVISSNRMSRRHATIVRRNGENDKSSFWIVDGDLEGNKSKNGILVNQQKCSERELQHGDVINFGYAVEARYLVVSDAEYGSDKPLGVVLQEADLVSASQVKIALQDQDQNSDLRLGEILSLRGWIKQETADFFADRWQHLKNSEQKEPIGQYLKQAALLDDDQINTILYEQEQMSMKFGSLAVYKGWLKQTTINFFLDSFVRGSGDSSKNLTRTINGILNSKQITLEQQQYFFEMMAQHSALSTFEQAGIQEICDRISSKELQIVS